MEYTIFTDGSCDWGDMHTGGWSYVLFENGYMIKEDSAGYYNTTHNRMELMAVLEALTYLKEKAGNLEDHKIELYSDSKYVIDTFNKKWLKKWVANNFADKSNVDLWIQLYELAYDKGIEFYWIKGHSNNYWNDYCDGKAQLAQFDLHLTKDLNMEDRIIK